MQIIRYKLDQRDEFPEIYVPTVFENYVVDIEIDGKPMELTLWDTAGQEDYDRLRPLSYPDTDAVIICYDISNPDSLTNIPGAVMRVLQKYYLFYLEKWLPEVKHFCPNAPILLVGNKKDLRNDEDIKRFGREGVIMESEGVDMAKQIGNYLQYTGVSQLNVPKVSEKLPKKCDRLL